MTISTIFLKRSSEITFNNLLPIYDHSKAVKNNNGTIERYCFSRNHCPKYNGILVASTMRAINAIVAIYCSFGNQNAVINAHLNTPPVHINPAVNPERPHHSIPVTLFAGNLRLGFINAYEANSISIIHKTIFRIV